MPSIQSKIVKTIIKINRYSWAKGSIEKQRSKQEKAGYKFRVLKQIYFEPVKINGLATEWIKTDNAMDGVVLYLHGGAFALGSINVYRELLARFAISTGLNILAINYRLAPEHPFPAALEDAVCAYDWLLMQGFDPARILIAGDSAGGGLTLSTLVALRDAGKPLSAGAVCLSPWVDLTLSSQSIQSNASTDPILNRNILTTFAEHYAGDYDMSNPLISPLYANLEGLPPLLIHVGTDEILYDEAVLFANKAQAAGVDVTLVTWEGMFHVFQMVPFLPETKMSLAHMAEVISRYL